MKAKSEGDFFLQDAKRPHFVAGTAWCNGAILVQLTVTLIDL
jgi:hypothetical protein